MDVSRAEIKAGRSGKRKGAGERVRKEAKPLCSHVFLVECI